MGSNRGWVVDELLEIGHFEAALSHLDELVMDEKYRDLAKLVYVARRNTMELSLMEECEDQKMWCVLKHLATAYVMSEEVCHAKEYDNDSVVLMSEAGSCLALAMEMVLGVERTECLRCLGEKK